MTAPLISIIVPCYNQVQYLPEALQSVLEQTYANWECIIVNDGSPDDTHKVAQEWLVKDTRFRYIKKQNGGLSSARNAGIEVAIGDYIQFLDCDDMLHSDKLIKSISILNKDNNIKAVISQFSMFTVNPNDRKPNSISFNQQSLNYENILFNWGDTFIIPIHCGLFDSKIIKTVGFDENFKAVEDWIMWLSFFKISEKAFFINESLAFYRHNQKSMTRDYKLIHENLYKAYEQIYKTLDREESEKFIFIILERLNNKIIDQKTKIKALEFKNKNMLRILLKKLKVKLKYFLKVKRLIL